MKGLFHHLKQLKRNVRSVVLTLVILLVSLFGIGYLLEGLYGMQFDLASVWLGVSTILGVGATGAVYHTVDSIYNSPRGESPDTPKESE